MKLKNAFRAVSVAAVLATASLSASAGYVVLDGWQMNVPNFTPTLTTNIGHLVLGGGHATVQQETSGGAVFVGARFAEVGNVFSVNYIAENSIGNGDFGFPMAYGPNMGLNLTFSGVTGVVTSVLGTGGFHYVFTGGTFNVLGTNNGGVSFTNYASGSIVGIGGDTAATGVIGGTAGDSNILAQILGMIGTFGLFDSTGASLQADMLAGNVLFQATTTNTVDQNSVVTGASCTFGVGPAVECLKANISSEGAANLVRAIPEPGSIALLGLGLLGLGAVRRRTSSK